MRRSRATIARVIAESSASRIDLVRLFCASSSARFRWFAALEHAGARGEIGVAEQLAQRANEDLGVAAPVVDRERHVLLFAAHDDCGDGIARRTGRQLERRRKLGQRDALAAEGERAALVHHLEIRAADREHAFDGGLRNRAQQATGFDDQRARQRQRNRNVKSGSFP